VFSIFYIHIGYKKSINIKSIKKNDKKIYKIKLEF